MSSSHDQDFGSELDNYLQQQQQSTITTTANEEEEQWTFDEKTGVYVMHNKRMVMYFVDNTWVCGDYDQVYQHDNDDRYIYDAQTQVWLDTLTNEYSTFDESTQTYVPLTDNYWQGHPESTQSIRFVVESSPFFTTGQVALVDESGMTIGRDRSWDARLRLPEMMVSKYHAMVFLDKQEKLFYMIDNGSQHGTFVNEKRLSEPKQASLPYELRHNDTVKIGSTILKVHLHDMGWPCQACLANEFIPLTHEKKKQQEQKNQSMGVEDLEKSRIEWIKNAKKVYTEDTTTGKEGREEYVDRAKIRRKNTKPEKFVREQQEEYTQQQEEEITIPTTYNTPVQGIGNKMLQKLGWQEGTSLGKRNDGILEPINPAANTSKLGLGISTAQPSLANESKKEKQWRLAQERYKTLI